MKPSTVNDGEGLFVGSGSGGALQREFPPIAGDVLAVAAAMQVHRPTRLAGLALAVLPLDGALLDDHCRAPIGRHADDVNLSHLSLLGCSS